MADKATTDVLTGKDADQLKLDPKEPMNIMIRHSTIVRVLDRHRRTKRDTNEIIDEAINYYLDSSNSVE